MSFLNTAEKSVACERKPKGTWKRGGGGITKGYIEMKKKKEKKNVLGTWESSLLWAGRNPKKIGFRKR